MGAAESWIELTEAETKLCNDIFKLILMKNCCVYIQISVKFVLNKQYSITGSDNGLAPNHYLDQ